jgi:hypothetical protein
MVAKHFSAAVDKWNGLVAAGQKPKNVTTWAKSERVVPTTFSKRLAQTDPCKHPKLGRPSTLTDHEMDAVVDAVAACDFRRKGKDVAAIIRMIQKVFNVTPEVAGNLWQHTVKHRRSNLLHRATAQASTNARLTAITEPNQRWYHKLVDEVFAVARAYSKRDDPNFDEQEYDANKSRFAGNLDESCAMSIANSNKVVGVRGHAHYTGIKDGRHTLTSMHVGTPHQVAGSAYLVAGNTEKLPPVHWATFGNEEWLRRAGAPPGSRVFVNENAFMTDATWDVMAPWLVSSIRSLDVVKAHPLWWFVLFLDGYHAHIMTLLAQTLLFAARILVCKENADSSQNNQVFDDVPGAAHKSEHRLWCSVLREYTPTGVIADQVSAPSTFRCEAHPHSQQMDLLLVVLTSERAVTAAHWRSAFDRVNLNPDTRVNVDLWLSRIYGDLAGGSKGHPYRAYLTAIKVPEFYQKLGPQDMRELRALTNPATGFDWTGTALSLLPPRIKEMLWGVNFSDFFTFTMSMGVAAELGLVQVQDLLPSGGTPTAAGTLILAHPVNEIDLDKEINELPSYQPARFKALADNVRAMLEQAAKHPKNPKRKARINQIGDLVSVGCWANDPKRVLRLEQEANMKAAYTEMTKIKQAQKQETAERKAVLQATKKQKQDEYKPILELFRNEGTWPPPHEAGKKPPTTPNLDVFIAFVKKHAIGGSVPAIVGKALSKANIVPFFAELCRQVTQSFRFCSSHPLLCITPLGTCHLTLILSTLSAWLDQNPPC